MKVLFCGDKHLKINRFDLAKSFLSWLNEQLVIVKPDLYVCLGDDMDGHSIICSQLLAELRFHFDYILSLGIPIIYVVGNHDGFRPNSITYHALQSMVGIHKNFYVIDKVQDLFGMTFVPFIYDPLLFPTRTLPICVAHQTFRGSDYGAIITKDGVDSTLLKGTEIVISGHIHKRQRFQASKDSADILYVGSPFSQSASDINQVKGISIFDTETYAEIFIQCPMPMWRSASFTVDPVYTLECIHNDLMYTLNDTDHWVIELTGPKAELIGYLGSKGSREILAKKNIKVKTVFTDKEKKLIQIKATSINLIIGEYIDKVYTGAIDRELLKKTTLGIITSSTDADMVQ